MADVVVTLPDELRGAFKDPLGPLETDPETLLSDVTGPLVAVGDVVTYHFLRVGRRPDVAVIDERTKRAAVDDEVGAALADISDDLVEVENPPATLSADLLTALRDAIASPDPETLYVDGEEDLATLPAVLMAPEGASVVYGQPDEGMVHVRVTSETKARVRDLCVRMDGDVERLLRLCGVEA